MLSSQERLRSTLSKDGGENFKSNVTKAKKKGQDKRPQSRVDTERVEEGIRDARDDVQCAHLERERERVMI
jgi:hypothetical protein